LRATRQSGGSIESENSFDVQVGLAPWQQIILNAAAADIVKNLIGRAAVAMWNMEEVFHVADFEVGHAPGANLPRRA
jgi:hypothetical protein